MNSMIDSVAQAITYFLAMLLALTLREVARAYVAYMCGDPTPKHEGRMSLNPAVHANMFGTVILPLIGFLAQFPIIGWANPVPIDERNFKRPVLHPFLTTLSGTFFNFILAFIGVLLLNLYMRYFTDVLPKGHFFYPVVELCRAFVFVNAALGIFHLIPLPPLDGAGFVRAVVSRDTYDRYESTVAPYAFFIILGLAFAGAFKWVAVFAYGYVNLCNAIVSLFL